MHCKPLAAAALSLCALAFPANALAWDHHNKVGPSQQNIAVQQNHQGGQVNFSPQVQVASADNGNGLITEGSGDRNSDSQTTVSQNQGNAALQANDSSNGSQDNGGDPKSGSGQTNLAGQGNSQGGQLNVSPQVQIASGDNGNGLVTQGSGDGNSDSQTTATQNQGNLLLQGNGSNS